MVQKAGPGIAAAPAWVCVAPCVVASSITLSVWAYHLIFLGLCLSTVQLG